MMYMNTRKIVFEFYGLFLLLRQIATVLLTDCDWLTNWGDIRNITACNNVQDNGDDPFLCFCAVSYH